MLGFCRPSRARRAAAAVVASLAFAAGLAAAPGPAVAASAEESLLLSLTNAVRAGAGAGPLALDGTLSHIARRWSQQMAAAGTISHNPGFKDQLEGAGFTNWVKTGENVGMGPTVQAIQNALVNSPGHYRNMVDGAFTEVGIGIVFANGTFWVTVNFVALSAAPAPAPAPPPPPPPAPRFVPDPTPPPAPPPTAPPPPPPPPPPTTTATTEPPPPTTTVPPATTTTTLAPPPPSSLPMQVALMVQQLRVLGSHR